MDLSSFVKTLFNIAWFSNIERFVRVNGMAKNELGHEMKTDVTRFVMGVRYRRNLDLSRGKRFFF